MVENNKKATLVVILSNLNANRKSPPRTVNTSEFFRIVLKKKKKNFRTTVCIWIRFTFTFYLTGTSSHCRIFRRSFVCQVKLILFVIYLRVFPDQNESSNIIYMSICCRRALKTRIPCLLLVTFKWLCSVS